MPIKLTLDYREIIYHPDSNFQILGPHPKINLNRLKIDKLNRKSALNILLLAICSGLSMLSTCYPELRISSSLLAWLYTITNTKCSPRPLETVEIDIRYFRLHSSLCCNRNKKKLILNNGCFMNHLDRVKKKDKKSFFKIAIFAFGVRSKPSFWVDLDRCGQIRWPKYY